MKAHLPPHSPMQALIKAIFEVRPPVLKDIRINTPAGGFETVSLEVQLSPELIKAWSEHCKEIK